MGFRSQFIVEQKGDKIPDWFTEKYSDYSFFKNSRGENTCFAQLYESKFYNQFDNDERILDIQKIIKESNIKDNSITMILLHECGGITRLKIFSDNIIASEPTQWKRVDKVEHSYCYGCSDLN